MVAVPAWVRKRSPAKPDPNELSVAVTIHALGCEADAGQTLAVRVDPTARNSIVYAVPAVAANGVLPRTVVAPPTFF
jgi:hypothetical protein